DRTDGTRAPLGRSTIPMGPRDVPIHPITGQPMAPRTTLPMPANFVPKSPTPWAMPLGRGKGFTFKMPTVPRQDPPPSSTAGVAQASEKSEKKEPRRAGGAGVLYLMAPPGGGVSVGGGLSVVMYGGPRPGPAPPSPPPPPAA